MRLTDPWFEAAFIQAVAGSKGFHRLGPSSDGAHGVFLWCPCAYPRDERAHGLIVPFVGAPAHNFGVTARDGTTKPQWSATGAGLSDLTLAPSVDVGTPSCWHGHITNGEIT